MLNLVLTCTLSAHYVDHVAWVGYGDGWGDIKFRVNLHAFCTLRRSRCLGLLWDGCGDVKFRVNLHAFCTLRRSRCLGLGMEMGGVILNFVLTCTLSAHYVDHVAWVCCGDGCGDVKSRVNLHAFCTLCRSRCLGFVVGMGVVMLNLVLTCTLSAHYVDHVAWVGYGDGWGDY